MLRLSVQRLFGWLKQVSKTVLNKLHAEINVFRNTIKMAGRRESKEVTGRKQSAKRRQWAGRLITDRARNKNNIGKSGYLR